jgi:uncharacterized protein RhaS with RHS repeats
VSHTGFLAARYAQAAPSRGGSLGTRRITWRPPWRLPNPGSLTRDHRGLHPLSQTERITAADAPGTKSTPASIVTDLVGTPTELIDESGDIAWRTRSTLWGTTAWAADSTAYTPLRFPGQYFDPETGLHYNYFRHYAPGSDPLGLAPGVCSRTGQSINPRP